MSRPLMVVGFVFLFSLIIINNLFFDVSWIYMVILIGLSLLTIPFLIMKKGVLASVVCLTVTAAYIMMYVFTTVEYKPALKYEGSNKQITAQALEYPDSSGSGMTCLMKLKEISGNKTNIKAKVYFSKGCNIKPYEIYTFQADIKGFGTQKDTERYFVSEGIYLQLEVDGKTEFVSSHKNIGSFFINLRKTLSERLNDSLSRDVAGFANAIFLGERSFIDDETVEAFNITGSSHILAVSGLHMSIWVMVIYNLLRKLAVNEKIASVVGILLFLVLSFLIGFRYSLLRSGIMLIVLLSANFFEREADSRNSLGLAVLIICMINPFSVMNSGFQMSVFATLGILVIHPALYELLTKRFSEKHNFFFSLLKSLISIVSVTVSANIALIPIYIFGLKTIPLISVISNLLIISLSSIVMVISAGTAIFFGIPILSDVFTYITNTLGKFILFIVRTLSKIPYASVYVHKDYVKYWLVVALVICAFTLILIADRKRRLKINALLCTVAFATSFLVNMMVESTISKIDLFSKSDGYLISIRHEGTCILIDYDSNKITCEAIETYMTTHAIDSIDLLVCNSDSKALKLGDKIDNKILMDENESFSLTVNDAVAINYYEKFNDSIYFDIGATNGLILKNSKVEYKELPDAMKSADLLICNNNIPLSFNGYSYGNIMVSQKSDDGFIEDNAYSTATEGTLSYRCTDNGNYEIRGIY